MKTKAIAAAFALLAFAPSANAYMYFITEMTTERASIINPQSVLRSQDGTFFAPVSVVTQAGDVRIFAYTIDCQGKRMKISSATDLKMDGGKLVKVAENKAEQDWRSAKSAPLKSYRELVCGWPSSGAKFGEFDAPDLNEAAAFAAKGVLAEQERQRWNDKLLQTYQSGNGVSAGMNSKGGK